LLAENYFCRISIRAADKGGLARGTKRRPGREAKPKNIKAAAPSGTTTRSRYRRKLPRKSIARR
jgi:hypothetical protein